MTLDRCTKNGFQAISYEYIGVLDSHFIHRYIIIKYRASSIKDKIHQLFIIKVMAFDLGTKNCFWGIFFEYIGVLDSYFIHMYIIIEHRSSSIAYSP